MVSTMHRPANPAVQSLKRIYSYLLVAGGPSQFHIDNAHLIFEVRLIDNFPHILEKIIFRESVAYTIYVLIIHCVKSQNDNHRNTITAWLYACYMALHV